ncbi:uncharacterized protein LOC113272102 [Papaver somniferum]|uniref:uncharacterized protein LOC113272102 n=1 Tax=Papaver somniferum TaxID=3469 RepID=UPI000E6FFB7A|nr:uncharacterized protein LOC113272102 [Papaver somniferum]
MAPVTRCSTSRNATLAANVRRCTGIPSSRLKKVKATINGKNSSLNWFLTSYQSNENFRNLVKDFISKRNSLKSRITASLEDIVHYERMLSQSTNTVRKLKKELSKLTVFSKDLEELNDPFVNGLFNNEKEFSEETLEKFIIAYDEKKGGRRTLRVSVQDFRECLDLCKLMQAARTGIQFSWCNNRAWKKRILCDLDKAFINVKWMEVYEVWSYKVGVRGVSEHGALFGSVIGIPKPLNIPFRYQDVWTTHPDFLNLIQHSWSEPCEGNPAFQFIFKLKRFKQRVKQWNWNVFGDLRKKVQTTEEDVMKASLLSDADPENINLLNDLVTAWGRNELSAQQYNTLMHAKSRIKWVKEGGANTAFFRANMRIRQTQNVIVELEDKDRNVVIDQKVIANMLVEQFQNKFKKQPVHFSEDIFKVIPKVLTTKDNDIMDVVPSCEEIKKVVFGMDANSSPGPDGFLGSFYKFAWEVVGMDLIKAIQYCWKCRFIPKGFNSNFLFLLPKVKGAKKAEQFRPNGLENFSFKIITRIITTRLSSMVNKLVSSQQGAFIKGRTIHEKIVLASEMINEMNVKRRGGNVGLKLDISQSYDFLSLEFLFEVLRRFGFSEVGINWLRILFTSSRIFVLVNGSPCGFFEVSRGLRQGDPLSPILFVIAEEVLSRNLTQMVQEGKIQAMVRNDGRVKEPTKGYLGVILNPGRVKEHQVWGSVEMMQEMLASWRGTLLAFPSRLTLVKFVLCRYPIFTISVYKWLKVVIKECERIIRNFLWTGDPAEKKLITVKWEEVNAPISEGGLSEDWRL